MTLVGCDQQCWDEATNTSVICTNQMACKSVGGSCTDAEFISNPNGVCIVPMAFWGVVGGCSDLYNNLTPPFATANIGCVDMGGAVQNRSSCVEVSKYFYDVPPIEQLTNGEAHWYYPAHSEAACLSVGGCLKVSIIHTIQRASFIGPPRTPSQCACGEPWTPYWQWNKGRWLNATAGECIQQLTVSPNG